MSHPPIQIVDKNDQPIGSMSIGEAHEQGAIHRVIRIIIENPNNKKILLQKRTPNMQSWPNCWSESVAGHVDVGEDYLTAAIRELSEELGIHADKLEEVDKYYIEHTRQDGTLLKRFNMLYRFYTEATEFKLQESEVSEARWFTLQEVKDLVREHPDQVTDGLKYLTEHYLT